MASSKVGTTRFTPYSSRLTALLVLTFSVAVDDAAFLEVHNELADSGTEARRRYITAVTQHRMHQQGFRERVLDAYRNRCAICRLRHPELLEAAHILPDGHPNGDPIVPNGLSLCKLHHAAFDGNFLGIRPDYVIELRRDILDERDGTMLEYGIQAFHNHPLIIPRPPDLRPDPHRLDERYRLFRNSA
ncbi:MAG: HNH endonuclease [Lentisphaerae bacterium]|jgi:putative restriction endonuclease|nr:HNH endonuclease [Lentisphaerota bacterium]MBT5611993.1 HNH endonuclease [Lentisphaerota bacterium]MBT7061262.1 HNH endonuclease [Lentisphaerota bacterium]